MKNHVVWFLRAVLTLPPLAPLTAQTIDLLALRFDIPQERAPLTCENVVDGGLICCSHTVCAGDPIQEIRDSISPTGGSGALEYAWLQLNFVPGMLPFWDYVPNATGPSLPSFPATDTAYFIRDVRRAGCPVFVSSNVIQVRVLPADQPDCLVASGNIIAGALTLSPNPFYETCTLRNGSQTPRSVSVRTLNGTVIDAFEVAGGEEKRIDGTGWPSGIYLVRGGTGNGEIFLRKMVRL